MLDIDCSKEGKACEKIGFTSGVVFYPPQEVNKFAGKVCRAIIFVHACKVFLILVILGVKVISADETIGDFA